LIFRAPRLCGTVLHNLFSALSMTMRPWRKISESILFKNPWWTYKLDMFELTSGKAGEYHYVHSNGSSMIIPIMDDGKIITVNQYRYLVDRESIEFPCGAVKDGATHGETASHELAEETGYSAKWLSLAGQFNPYNGVTNEMCHVYIGRELHYVGGKPDETEEFEVIPLTCEEIDRKIVDGTIWDGMTIAAWAMARTKITIG
jgi:ADP-ribose pyrophosphatase